MVGQRIVVVQKFSQMRRQLGSALIVYMGVLCHIGFVIKPGLRRCILQQIVQERHTVFLTVLAGPGKNIVFNILGNIRKIHSHQLKSLLLAQLHQLLQVHLAPRIGRLAIGRDIGGLMQLVAFGGI